MTGGCRLARSGALLVGIGSRDAGGLHVELPAERPSEHALALRITR